MNCIKLLLIDFQGYSADNDSKLYDNLISLPLGPMYLSSYIKNYMKNCEIRVIKSLVDFKSEDEFFGILNDFEPDIIGMRGISIFLDALLKCAEKIKKVISSDSKIIVGGPITSSDTDALIGSNLFDNVIIGEGEEVLLNIVKEYAGSRSAQNGSTKDVDKSSIICQGFTESLNDLPFPDYSVIDFSKYEKFIGFTYRRKKHGGILTSRGCPYKCRYCHNIFGKTARLRSVDSVIEEIKFLRKNYGIQDFCIIDDIFNIDYERSIRIFNQIIKENLQIKLYFSNGIRGDILDEKFIDYMIEAGTVLVTFAVETASERLQKLIRKNVNLEKITRNIQYASKKDLLVNVFFMIGFPSETMDEAISTLKYADSLEFVTAPILNFVKYYEGTEMYELAKTYGFSDEMIKNSCGTLYQDPSRFYTPTLTNQDIRKISQYFTYNVVGSSDRVTNMIRVLRIHFSEEEVLDYLNFLHPFKSSSISEFMKKMNFVSRVHGKSKNIYDYFGIV